MADYPGVGQEYSTKRTPVSGQTVDLAVDGTPHVRQFFTETTYRFDVRHELLTTAQKDSILAVYEANRTALVVFTWDSDGADYNVFFEEEPAVQHRPGDRWDVTSKLIGRKA